VGTHGWFPNKLLNKIVGEPRGTSQLLIEKTLNSLQAYQKQHNMESDIKYIALQGQGKVQERVDSYYSTIVKDKEYMKILQQSDQIICASHSQGFIVSTLLLKKLLQNKIINNTTRIGSLLLAGINHKMSDMSHNLQSRDFFLSNEREINLVIPGATIEKKKKKK
jgi:triacylglycerol esterase/lipase EstA (alpha/beta hydrolase family)